MNRRSFLWGVGALRLCAAAPVTRAAAETISMANTPLELGGEWGASPEGAAAAVITRMREVCLSGVRLLSDRQPDKLRVDDHSSGPPAVWLHDDHTRTAWIIVDIGARDWSKLAYQFGHELGHVLCNSWETDAKPRPPCQWLEESMVEAFSIRGLGLLAESWERAPPFAGDQAFAKAIREYRGNVIAGYRGAHPIPNAEMAAWFRKTRSALEHSDGLNVIEGPAILAILAELESDKARVEDMGAVNRLPSRSGVALETYLDLWEKSCGEIRAPGQLPARLRTMLEIG
jgi:hypothetical protein